MSAWLGGPDAPTFVTLATVVTGVHTRLRSRRSVVTPRGPSHAHSAGSPQVRRAAAPRARPPAAAGGRHHGRRPRRHPDPARRHPLRARREAPHHRRRAAAPQRPHRHPHLRRSHPHRARGASPPAAARRARRATRTHTVARGDTFIGIAARYGVSRRPSSPAPTACATATSSGSASRLTVPGAHAAPKATIAAPRPGAPTPARPAAAPTTHRAELARRNTPSQGPRSRPSSPAPPGRSGVDPALARAVAYQESGFQAHLVSPADAVGAMQVLPGTADWMSRYAGRRLDVLDPADNALAGVLLLRTLLRRHRRRRRHRRGRLLPGPAVGARSAGCSPTPRPT